MAGKLTKEDIRNFYKEFFHNQKIDYAKKIIAPYYIQHNPGVEDGREGFIHTFADAFASGKKFHIEIEDIILGEDMAAVILKNQRGSFAVVDFYRINSEGQLCEHWDVFSN